MVIVNTQNNCSTYCFVHWKKKEKIFTICSSYRYTVDYSSMIEKETISWTFDIKQFLPENYLIKYLLSISLIIIRHQFDLEIMILYYMLHVSFKLRWLFFFFCRKFPKLRRVSLFFIFFVLVHLLCPIIKDKEQVFRI